MSIIIEIRCNAGECPEQIRVVAHEISTARTAARTNGWQTRKSWDPRKSTFAPCDYCPQHAQTESSPRAYVLVGERVSRENCWLGKKCYSIHFTGQDRTLMLELYDWCGHDNLGHRMANILVREGYETLPLVLAAEEADLLDLRGFGTLCFARYRKFKEKAHAAS